MTENYKTISTAIEKPHHAAIVRPDLSISAGWGTVSGGGCTLTNTNLTLNDNGTAIFSGQIEGTNNAAENGITLGGFGLHDANGVELYRTPSGTFLGGTYQQVFSFSLDVLYPGYMCAYLTTIVFYHQ